MPYADKDRREAQQVEGNVIENVSASISVLLISVGCKKQSSELKHNFGETKRKNLAEFETCDRNNRGTSPIATSYLYNLFDHIVANNPDTFVGDLASDQFCLRAMKNRHVNAIAETHKRTIIFDGGMFLLAETDAEVASILAHEIAHITMAHGMGGTNFDYNKDSFTEREVAIRKLGDKIAVLNSQYNGQIDRKLSVAGNMLLALKKSDPTAAEQIDKMSGIIKGIFRNSTKLFRLNKSTQKWTR